MRQSDSAAVAKRRLQFVLAMDRAAIDGRARVAELYGTGVRLTFDRTIAVLPDEELMLDYSITDGVTTGHVAAIHQQHWRLSE